MRILLDEQLPRRLAPHLLGHDVRTVQQESWAGLKNGVLLSEAEAAGFSVLVTGDQNLEHQQNLTKRKLGIVVLGAASNALGQPVGLRYARRFCDRSVWPRSCRYYRVHFV